MKTDLSKIRHARSQKDFPGVSLEDDEYVELSLHRSRILPILIWSGVALATILCVVVLTIFNFSGSFGVMKLDEMSRGLMTLVILVVLAAIFISALVATRVYSGNHLYVTNKRVIQQSMISLFDASTNVIDLISVEDVSFKQTGILEHLLNIGTLRMATVGEETTYTFKYADRMNAELKTITHLVHEAKDDDKK